LRAVWRQWILEGWRFLAFQASKPVEECRHSRSWLEKLELEELELEALRERESTFEP
jgi:hypothetical protein